MTDARALSKSFDSHGLQFAWNSSSIKLAEACLRKYQYAMIEGWQSALPSAHLIFGGHFATALEHYHKALALGTDPFEALLDVVHEALIATWEYDQCDCNGFLNKCETCGGKNGGQYGGQPWDSLHNLKTRGNLIRSIVWYIDHFADDTMPVIQLSDGPAVELSFTLEVDDGLVFAGHLDRLVTYGEDPYVMDQKAQPLTTKVLTDNGWVEIQALSIGDKVIGQDGTETEVIGLFPKGVTEVYRVKFNDGSSVKCGIDHLWTVQDQFGSWKTIEMKEMLGAPAYKKFAVPLVKPIQHSEKELPLHPYLIGALLGDGYLNGNSIQLSSTKQWLIDNVVAVLPEGDKIKKASKFNNSWTISGGPPSSKTLRAIESLGLRRKLSTTKFIPTDYLIGSEEQRRQLLAGLLDTDGGWNDKHRIYDSMSFQLIRDVCQLVRSLGGTARYRVRADGCYRASIRMPEFPSGVGKRYITGIERIEDEETMCIKVSADDGLYVTENYIVTHNTTGSTITQRFFEQFKPDTQMSMYSFAGKMILGTPVKGVIIDGAQIAVGFTRFERGFTFRTDGELNEWYDSAMYHIEQARNATRKMNFPMNTASCGNYGGCPFRAVCARDPEHRSQFLKADFVQGKPLDPLEQR